jgi:hypothetical protein
VACLVAVGAAPGCSAGGTEVEGGSGGSAASGSGGLNLSGTGGTGATSGSGQGGSAAGQPVSYPILIDPGCESAMFEFESVTPTVMILVDRSSSMFDVPYYASPNRWQPLKDALVGDGATYWGVVGDLQGAVRFGFAAYTAQQVNIAQVCPSVLGAEVGIALDNYLPIRAAYDNASHDPIDEGQGAQLYKGETPTGAAVRVVTGVLGAFQEPGPKYILLVTDGQPDTCGVPDPQCGQDDAVAAVQEARALPVPIQTFVIGIEMTEFDASRHLTQVANAGLGLGVARGAVFPNCDAHLQDLPLGGNAATYTADETMGWALPYLPQNPEQLAWDIVAVIGGMRSCVFNLTQAAINTTRANEGSVQLQDQVLMYGDPNGWEMISETELEIKGTSCDVVRLTPHPFMYVSFPCDVYVY